MGLIGEGQVSQQGQALVPVELDRLPMMLNTRRTQEEQCELRHSKSPGANRVCS